MEPRVTMARRRRVLLGLVIAGLLLFAWWQHRARTEAERSLGLDAARIVSAEFSKRADLRVAVLRGKVVASGTDKGFLGVLPSEQVTALPYTVDYYVNLSKIGHGAYRWDSASKTLGVDIPDVTVGAPNIDEGAAATDQKGVFISRRAGLELARQTSVRAAAKSREEARKPENLAKARESARDQVAKMAALPLAAAGLKDVLVEVRFPWEPKSERAAPVEEWDRSRALEDVMKQKPQARTS